MVQAVKGLSSVWAPASQDFSHVGNAGVGVVSMRGAPVAMPTFATAQFKRFFDCGRAVRCLLPLGGSRFMNLAVLYGDEGADADAEQLALTEQLFDAALPELAVVARGQPCLIAGDFNVEPTKIPCLSKGISAGLWVDLAAAWSVARGQQPAVTWMRSWESNGGGRRREEEGREGEGEVIAGTLLLRSSQVQSALLGGCSPTLLSGLLLIVTGGLARSLSL